MNWKDDQIEKLNLFILTIVCFWYQISGTRNPATGTRNWYQILVPVSGQYVMGITEQSADAYGMETTAKQRDLCR